MEPSIIGVKGETARGIEERRTLGREGGVSGTRVGNRGERGCAVPMKRTMEAGCSFVCGHCCSPGRKHELRALLSLSLSQQSTTPLRHSSFRTVSFYSPHTTPSLNDRQIFRSFADVTMLPMVPVILMLFHASIIHGKLIRN